MAEKEILFERVLTIPMRKVYNRPDIQRAPFAIRYLKRFVARHTNTTSDDVWIDGPLNRIIWKRGAKRPPKSIKVRIIKWDDQTVEVDLPEE